jgi:hypothetical protein
MNKEEQFRVERAGAGKTAGEIGVSAVESQTSFWNDVLGDDVLEEDVLAARSSDARAGTDPGKLLAKPRAKAQGA